MKINRVVLISLVCIAFCYWWLSFSGTIGFAKVCTNLRTFSSEALAALSREAHRWHSAARSQTRRFVQCPTASARCNHF